MSVVSLLPAGVVDLADEPLARHTALRTGGACEHFVVVHRNGALGDTVDALKAAGLSIHVIGAGTRTVYRDGESTGAMLRLGTGFARIERGAVWTVGAATPCPALAWAAAGEGRAGVEALARAPGSLGAALVLDEGPWREVVREIAVWHRGQLRWKPVEAARKARLVVAARLELRPDHVEAVRERTRAALAGARSLPSWYETLKGGTAGAELARVQAVGVRLRGVMIPESAPEMIVNVGRGPATDLRLLHRSALERVKKLRGVELSSAVKWAGRA